MEIKRRLGIISTLIVVGSSACGASDNRNRGISQNLTPLPVPEPPTVLPTEAGFAYPTPDISKLTGSYQNIGPPTSCTIEPGIDRYSARIICLEGVSILNDRGEWVEPGQPWIRSVPISPEIDFCTAWPGQRIDSSWWVILSCDNERLMIEAPYEELDLPDLGLEYG